MNNYKYETYGTNTFFIQEDYYSIEQIEEILKECREQKEHMDKMRGKSMEMIK
jgi:hypothetical protein